jgi:hypothetical protein
METPIKRSNQTTTDDNCTMDWTLTTPESIPPSKAVPMITCRSSGNNASPITAKLLDSPSLDSPILFSADNTSDNESNALDPELRSSFVSEDDELSTQSRSISPKIQTSTSNGPKIYQRTTIPPQWCIAPARTNPASPAEYLNPVPRKVVRREQSLYHPGEIFSHPRCVNPKKVNTPWHITWPEWVEPPPQVILSSPVCRSGGVNSRGEKVCPAPSIYTSVSCGSSPPHRYVLPAQRYGPIQHNQPHLNQTQPANCLVFDCKHMVMDGTQEEHS